MIAQELEVSLHMAFMDARQKRHELITVEHLLLAMLDNPSASEVLNSCGANLDKLREDVVGHPFLQLLVYVLQYDQQHPLSVYQDWLHRNSVPLRQMDYLA